MFEQAVTLLLSGEFICAVRYPDAYRFLSEGNSRGEVEGFLAKLGRRLATTKHGAAYYGAYVQIAQEERKAVKEEFADIKHNLRLLVNFILLVMQATQREEFLSSGSVIEANKLMAAIDENPNFRSELQSLANISKGYAADGTHRGMLEKILRKLKDEGYLILANSEREIYQVTGKVEYLQEVIDFLMEHESIKEDVEEQPETGTLL